MDDSIDKELEKAVSDTFSPPSTKMFPRKVQPPAMTETSLTEQLTTMERIKWELRQRIVDGRLELEDEYRRRRSEIDHKHERALLKTHQEMEESHRNELVALAEEIRTRLQEIENLRDRLDG